MQIDDIIDFTAQKIISGLPEWNHSSAKNDSEIQKTKDLFLQKMNNIKEKSITDETVVLRTIDYCIAKYVPDEHVSVKIKDEKYRAGYELIKNDKEVAYKIPPLENNNNLATSNNEKFAKSQSFTLVAPSDKDKKSNILVATKEQNGQNIGVIAIDSFMIEMGNEQTREEVSKIADYVLQQSQNWDNIIFDFRGNGGGDSTIIKEIGERLSKKELKYADKIEVINEELDEPTGAPGFYPQKRTDKTFTGNIYVLQDGGNASATEGAIWMLRQMKNCTTIGENTHGAFAGGDVKSHEISDTVVLKLGNTYRERYMPDRQKVLEGKGIPADKKCSSSEAYEKALTCIHNKLIIHKLIKSLRGIKTKNHATRQVPKAPPIQHKDIKQTLINKYYQKKNK